MCEDWSPCNLFKKSTGGDIHLGELSLESGGPYQQKKLVFKESIKVYKRLI